MATSPLVSVILPAYNAQSFLGHCVESVLSQTVGDFELIIVDDGSEDTTGAIAEGLAAQDRRIKTLHQHNSGLSAARNAGLSIATGQNVAFVDADDTLHPAFLEYAINEMADAGADIFSCAFTRKESEGWGELRPKRKAKVLRPCMAIEAILYQRKNMHNSAWAHLYKAEILKNLRFTEGLLYEDLDFFYKAYENAGTVAHSDFPLYYYRVNPEGILHTFSSRRLDVCQVANAIVEHYRDLPRLRNAAIDRRFAANFNMYALCAISGNSSASHCWSVIEADRLKILLNPKSRLKNRMGALMSFLGQKVVKAIAHLIYSNS